jgi:hypothetical protein
MEQFVTASGKDLPDFEIWQILKEILSKKSRKSDFRACLASKKPIALRLAKKGFKKSKSHHNTAIRLTINKFIIP